MAQAYKKKDTVPAGAPTLFFGPQTTDEKRISAEARKKERAALTPAQQIAILDARLGKGIGATKERARLASQMKSAKAA